MWWSNLDDEREEEDNRDTKTYGDESKIEFKDKEIEWPKKEHKHGPTQSKDTRASKAGG